MPLYGLVLAGGQSSRMKMDKGALMIEGQTLRQRAAEALAFSCEKVYLSARRDQNISEWNPEEIIYDELKDAGPAAALLAAHQRFPEVDWFILACDFPYVETSSVKALALMYQEILGTKKHEVFCYQNIDKIPEPLFAIWKASALVRLRKNFSMGLSGPIATLRESNPLIVEPEFQKFLFNANTEEDWKQTERSSPRKP